jgi:hypothetical protein
MENNDEKIGGKANALFGYLTSSSTVSERILLSNFLSVRLASLGALHVYSGSMDL